MNRERLQQLNPTEWVVFTSEGLCGIRRSYDGSKHMAVTPWGQEEVASFDDAVKALGEAVDMFEEEDVKEVER